MREHGIVITHLKHLGGNVEQLRKSLIVARDSRAVIHHQYTIRGGLQGCPQLGKRSSERHLLLLAQSDVAHDEYGASGSALARAQYSRVYLRTEAAAVPSK